MAAMVDASEGPSVGSEAWLASMEAWAQAMLAGDGVAQRGGQQDTNRTEDL